jgi:hypothetical protein
MTTFWISTTMRSMVFSTEGQYSVAQYPAQRNKAFHSTEPHRNASIAYGCVQTREGRYHAEKTAKYALMCAEPRCEHRIWLCAEQKEDTKRQPAKYPVMRAAPGCKHRLWLCAEQKERDPACFAIAPADPCRDRFSRQPASMRQRS